MDQINKRDIPFAVSARTAKLIGFENFSNGDWAVIELVKNAYDADAKNCLIVFDIRYLEDTSIDKDQSKIFIIDDGIGMTEKVIVEQWMTIGTNNKVAEFLSEKERIRSWAKGIGRFALNRLWSKTKLYTYSKIDSSWLEWQVKWSDFDMAGKNVSDIMATIESPFPIDLKKHLKGTFPNFPKLQARIEDLSFDSGTVIEISWLNDDWEIEDLGKLYENLETLLPPKEERDFLIDLYYTPDVDRFWRVKSAYFDDFDYKVKAHYDWDDTIELVIHRNEFDLDKLQSSPYSEVFDAPEMKKFPYRLEDLKNEVITKKLSITKLFSQVPKNIIKDIGIFDFAFYFLKIGMPNDRGVPYKPISISHRKEWIKKFWGVKIFRDEFRVRPYWEYGDDWLRLGERQVKSPGWAWQKKWGYRIGPNQISGSIHISRIHNAEFQDKSGREGIIENEVFTLFKNLLIGIIRSFEEDRNTILFHLSDLHERKNEEARLLKIAEEEAARILAEEEAARILAESQKPKDNEWTKNSQEDDAPESDASEDNPPEGNSASQKALAKWIDILKNRLSDQEEELRLLRNLASTGLIVSSFAHELNGLEARLIPRTNHLIKILRTYISPEDLDGINPHDDPFNMLQLIQDDDRKIKSWLEYSLNTLKRDKRERVNIDFSIYFERLQSTWAHALENRKIWFQIHGEESCIIRAFEVDMDSIFNNLISNSIYALRENGEKQKNISIEWKRVGNMIEVIFSDTWRGLDSKYIDHPEKIFEFNETSKHNKQGDITGTGLGLYIVSTILAEYNNSDIAVINNSSWFTLKLTFQLPIWPTE